MSLLDCIQFANEHPACHIATTEGDQPRVRMLMMWFADESGFYFHSASSKNVCGQLQANPKTEACFYAPETPPDPGRMLRVAGAVEFLQDEALQNRLLRERPFLSDVKKYAPEGTKLVIFRIVKGEAHFWTMADNTKENAIERIRF